MESEDVTKEAEKIAEETRKVMVEIGELLAKRGSKDTRGGTLPTLRQINKDAVELREKLKKMTASTK